MLIWEGYQMSNKIKYPILFYVGFCTYITIECLFRGYSYFLMGITGAICFLIFDKINEYIPWELDLFWQGCIGSGVVTLFELVIGLILKWLNLPSMWDYSNMWMNYNGIICPQFSGLWILLAIIGIILADSINYYLLWNGDRPIYKLFHFVNINFPKRRCYC